MTPTEKFLRTPISFLEKNIILTPTEMAAHSSAHSRLPLGGRRRSTGGVCYMGLARVERVPGSGTVTRGIRDGMPCELYQLQPRDAADSDAFRVYWCPGQQMGMGGLVINNKASMMFSTTSRGSRLGVGHRSARGDRLISHIPTRSGSIGRLGGRATVFGRISSIANDWIFYAQKYDCSSVGGGRLYIHRGLVGLLEAVA